VLVVSLQPDKVERSSTSNGGVGRTKARDHIARIDPALVDAKVLLCLRVIMQSNSSSSGKRQQPEGVWPRSSRHLDESVAYCARRAAKRGRGTPRTRLSPACIPLFPSVKRNLARQLPISPDCVFDASLVPETCLDRFGDLKGLTQQVSGESRNRKLAVPGLFRYGVYQDIG